MIAAWYRMWGRVWIPPELRHLNEPAVLHLSDTPAAFFFALPGILRHLKPRWIIHTGDLVDDVKLGLNRAHLPRYSAKLRQLTDILKVSGAEGVYLFLGNHDDADVLAGGPENIHVIPCSQRLELGGMTFGASHYAAEAMAAGGDICLFGHNMDVRTTFTGSPRLLNGLEAIYIILPQSNRIFALPYPAGTDAQRLGLGKVGL